MVRLWEGDEARLRSDYAHLETIVPILPWRPGWAGRLLKARRPLAFHFTASNFWNSLESPCRCPHSNAHLSGNLAYAEALCS